MPKIFKPNAKMLERFILSESEKVSKLITPEEKSKDKVEVGDDTKKLNSLEKDMDFYKTLKIKEAKLKRDLKKIQERIKKVQKNIKKVK